MLVLISNYQKINEVVDILVHPSVTYKMQVNVVFLTLVCLLITYVCICKITCKFDIDALNVGDSFAWGGGLTSTFFDLISSGINFDGKMKI